MAPPLPLDVPKKEPYPALPAPILLDILEAMCARGFLRQATRLAMTSREVAAACSNGTGRQIYDAAKDGNATALTTYLAYWRERRERGSVMHTGTQYRCTYIKLLTFQTPNKPYLHPRSRPPIMQAPPRAL